MCKITIQKADLFEKSDPKSELAHCVSEDLVMGKGIAKIFKDKYKKVAFLKSQEKKVGEVAMLKHENRFIYYLITKKRYNHKPKYEDLKSTLKVMRNHMEKNNRFHLSIPKIGCGLDRLEWTEVQEIIEDVFHNEKFVIDVFYL